MTRKYFSDFFLFSALIAFTATIVINPENVAVAVKDALFLCGNSVIPSLFPFFVISNLITALDIRSFCEKHLGKITMPLFGISGALSPALVLGLIGGYPVGAIACASAYSERLCTKEDAEHALGFCNNCGPAFILGAIGNGIFKSAKTGGLLLAIHAASAFSVGILFRLFSPSKRARICFSHTKAQKAPHFATAFTGAVAKALNSSLSISAYIVLFSALVRIMTTLKIFPFLGYVAEKLSGADSEITAAFISGIFEMTVGSFSLSHRADTSTAFILISFLLGWGGLSVHCQALSFISETALSTRRYFLGKLLHGSFSALYAYICIRITDISYIAAFSDFSDSYGEAGFRGVFLIILFLFYFFCKKGWKKVK